MIMILSTLMLDFGYYFHFWFHLAIFNTYKSQHGKFRSIKKCDGQVKAIKQFDSYSQSIKTRIKTKKKLALIPYL